MNFRIVELEGNLEVLWSNSIECMNPFNIILNAVDDNF